MGAFSTKTVLNGDPSLIPAIAERICRNFELDGFQVKQESLLSGGADISVTKGGLFKAAIGLKTALKITLAPTDNGIQFEAGVGIFGHQVIPTLIMWFYAWPVLITQIWGMVQQSKLDDKALEIARSVITEHSATAYGNNAVYPGQPNNPAQHKFCTSCGAKLNSDSKFCSQCGAPLA